MAKAFFWSVKDLVEVAQERQKNEFDFILMISGRRGDGKSSLGFKFCNRFKLFNPWNHIIYSRKELMQMIEKLQYHVLMDDEAIRSGYKRNFQESDQKVLIQMFNMYRDNFNVYVGCIPTFYSLDKDLRNLTTVHINVVERGLAVVHMPNNNLYSDDPWDIKYNMRIEERWAEKRKHEPNFKPPYHKLSTFKGYITWGKLRHKMEYLYKEIKREKRKKQYEEEISVEAGIKKVTPSKHNDAYERIYQRLIARELDRDSLFNVAATINVKYGALIKRLNQMLKDNLIRETVSYFMKPKELIVETKTAKFGYVPAPTVA